MPKLFKASEPRSSPLNMKTTKGLRARLEASAAASGRALTHEAEHRIEQALDFDREFHGLEAAEIYNNIGRFLRLFNVSAFLDERHIARACLKSAFSEFIDEALPDPGNGILLPNIPAPVDPERVRAVEEMSRRIAYAVFAASHLDAIADLQYRNAEKSPRLFESLLDTATRTGLLDEDEGTKRSKRTAKKTATE